MCLKISKAETPAPDSLAIYLVQGAVLHTLEQMERNF